MKKTQNGTKTTQNRTTKLAFPRETLRTLQSFELHGAGGGAVFSDDNSGYPVLCTPDSDPCQ